MSHNTWIHRLVRPMVEPLVESPVTPDHVTTLRLIFGLSASAACMAGGEAWTRIAGVLFLTSMLLDRADGTLARLSGRQSRFGHRYDLVCDAVSNALIFIGLGIGLRDSSLGGWSVLLGGLAGLAVGVILLMVVLAECQEGERAAELPNLSGFDADDGMIVVPIAMLLGWALPLLYLASSITPLFALFFAWRYRRFFR